MRSELTRLASRVSGEVLLHKVKEKKVGGSLESMVAGLQSQKSEMEKKFDREMASQKDRSRILEEVWGYDFPTTGNALEVYIGYLRRKTEAEGEPRLIHTVRGIGYVLRADG